MNSQSEVKNDPLLERIQSSARESAARAREENRDAKLVEMRKFSSESSHSRYSGVQDERSLFQKLRNPGSEQKRLLQDLKKAFAEETLDPNEFFASESVAAFHNVVNMLASTDPELSLAACEALANCSPLNEKNGTTLARSAGPYFVTLLTSASPRLKEASAVAIGNLATSGAKIVKVLGNQEVGESLLACLEDSSDLNSQTLSAYYYALYRITASDAASAVFSFGQFERLIAECKRNLSWKAPTELFWTLFALSCHPPNHTFLATENIINRCFDISTYEIFQKSDSRPLVKAVTPLLRMVANVCAGPYSEKACLSALRHPDVKAILMALLGTNYTHLCRETLWLFSNIVNNESVLVQEELVHTPDFMDCLEFHTVQAIRKVDPYLTNVI